VRILFLGDLEFDYVSDPLYVGLSRILGEDQVVDFPYKPLYHDQEAKNWFMVQRPGRRYRRDDILDLLRSRYFDMVCLASFRHECLDESRRLYNEARFPAMVFIDGADDARIRHEIVRQYPLAIYFKRDYIWRLSSPLRDLGALTGAFRGNRKLYSRTLPLPVSIIVDALPDLPRIEKSIDVSYTGRASHPRRVRAVDIISHMPSVRFSGGIYASPGDRRYKLVGNPIKRLVTKVLDNEEAGASEQAKKLSPVEYYREIAGSKIALSIRGGGRTPSPRYYEIPALGTMLLSDPPESLIPNGFVHRQHAVFCRADLSDLKALVLYYLREDAEREAIAREGRLHLLKYHTCERRAEYFVEACRRFL